MACSETTARDAVSAAVHHPSSPGRRAAGGGRTAPHAFLLPFGPTFHDLAPTFQHSAPTFRAGWALCTHWESEFPCKYADICCRICTTRSGHSRPARPGQPSAERVPHTPGTPATFDLLGPRRPHAERNTIAFVRLFTSEVQGPLRPTVPVAEFGRQRKKVTLGTRFPVAFPRDSRYVGVASDRERIHARYPQ